MALDHAKPGQPVDIGPLGTALRESATHAILKTHSLPAGEPGSASATS